MKLENCVYRFLNKNDEIIYIGKAKNLKNRLNGHSHLPKECYAERVKIEFTMFDTEDDMDYAERYFIPKLNPKYNESMSCRNITLNIPIFDKVKWIVYSNNEEVIRKQIYKNNKNIERIRELRSKIASIEEELKTIDSAYRDMRKCLEDYMKSNECESFRKQGYILVNSEWVLIGRDRTETGIITNSLKEVIKREEEWSLSRTNKENLCKKLRTLKIDLLRIMIPKEEFRLLKDYELDILIKYNAYKKEDALSIIIKDITKKYIDDCCKDIEEKGYYLYSKLIHDINKEFTCDWYLTDDSRKWLYWIDAECDGVRNCNRTNAHKEIANKVIKDVEEYVLCKYGHIYEDTIILNKGMHLVTDIQIPQAFLIKRALNIHI